MCKCWLDAKARAIKAHEEGRGHREKLAEQQRAKKAAATAAAKEEARDAAAWAAIDAAARASFEKDLAAQGVKPASVGGYSAPPSQPPTAASLPAARPAYAAPAARPVAPPPPPPAPAKQSVWQATVDPATGATYWYNIVTMATSWTNPEEEEQKKKAEAAARKKRESEAGEASARGKRQKTADSDAAFASAAASASAGSSTAAASAEPEASNSSEPKWEVDENTGIGRWSVVEKSAEEDKAAAEADSNKPRMTPFGMLHPSSRSGGDSGGSSASAGQSSSAPRSRWKQSAGDADDAAEADEELDSAIDMAAQLRRQYGPSALVGGPTKQYDGAILDDGKATDSAQPVTVTFKKKTNRMVNQRMPVPASNK